LLFYSRIAGSGVGRAFDATEFLDVGFDETFPEGTSALGLPGVQDDRLSASVEPGTVLRSSCRQAIFILATFERRSDCGSGPC
jgi:hypothetical protein